jgi:putative hemolysin
MDVLLELLAVAAIIAGNAFFVIAEYAVVTARRTALEQRAAEGSGGAKAALRLMDDPVRVISAVQIAITGLGILLGAVGEPVVRELLGDGVPTWLSFALAFLVVTYLSVAFGELVPKAFALYAPEKVAIVVARPIDLFARLTAPAVWLLQLSARAVLKPLGVPAVSAGDRPISREELRGVLQDAEEHGTLGAEEEDMLTGVIDLRLREAGDIMRPWEDVDVVRLDRPAEEALDAMLSAAHTRFPAIEGDSEVVGVLHARDAWVAWRSEGGAPDLRSLVREVVMVPPSVRVDALLRMLRRSRQQLAVVLDEYGRPAGIATLEDILEEIVGEIEDEFDELDERFERISDHEWLVDGAVSVSDFNRHAEAHIDPGRARSIGGAVFEHFGRVPSEGESFDIDGVKLSVEQLDGHRIALVRAVVSDDRTAAA